MDLKQTSKRAVAMVALAGAITAGSASVAAAAEGGDPRPGAAAGEGVRHPRLRAAVRHAGAIVAETLGVERAQLRDALRGGQSIAAYAESLGKDPQAVVDALVGAANARIDQAVANGRITAERGEQAKAKVPERVARLVNREFGGRPA